MKTAVLYARVSSREQEQEGYSIPAQLKLLRDYASKNGFEIVKEFVDIETAKTAGRKAFGEMLTFLKRSRNERRVLVEKTDRLYRNLADCVKLEELDTEIHFVKTGNVVSKNAKAQTKFIHDIELASARLYSGNLREEVIKGMREKAEQGMYPGYAPIGYRNNRQTRGIEPDPEDSKIVKRVFELYATGTYPLTKLRKTIREEFGRQLNRAYIHRILTNPIYVGVFEWSKKTYLGKHETFIDQRLFDAVQAVMHGHNKGKYRKHDMAFRGMLHCHHDGCLVTGELIKQKYVYYRCTGFRGKCELPRFKEAEISEKMGQILKDIYIPEDVARQIEAKLAGEQTKRQREKSARQAKLESELTDVRRRMDQAYTDKLDGKITEDFWQRKLADWQMEEKRIQAAIAGLKGLSSEKLLDIKRIFELANKAYFLYVTRKPAEQAELLRKVLSNCTIDGVSVIPLTENRST